VVSRICFFQDLQPPELIPTNKPGSGGFVRTKERRFPEIGTFGLMWINSHLWEKSYNFGLINILTLGFPAKMWLPVTRKFNC